MTVCVCADVQRPGLLSPAGSRERLPGPGLQKQVQGSYRLLHGDEGKSPSLPRDSAAPWWPPMIGLCDDLSIMLGTCAAPSDPEEVSVYKVPVLWWHQNPAAVGQQYSHRKGNKTNFFFSTIAYFEFLTGINPIMKWNSHVLLFVNKSVCWKKLQYFYFLEFNPDFQTFCIKTMNNFWNWTCWAFNTFIL